MVQIFSILYARVCIKCANFFTCFHVTIYLEKNTQISLYIFLYMSWFQAINISRNRKYVPPYN